MSTSPASLLNTYVQGKLAVRVFVCFAFAYLLSYAYRAINAVIAPALVADLQLNNADLGLLSAAYLISFAALQLPLGVWLDKYGARRTESALLVFAAVGAAIFASAQHLWTLWIGRALIGVGVSACLMAAFTAYRSWFAPERQGQLASWMLVAGASGALLTTVPVQMALPSIGWRGVFWVMAGLTALAAGGIFYGLPQAVPHAPPLEDAPIDGGYASIFRNPFFWRMMPLAWFNQGGFIALQTLWLGPWLTAVLGIAPEKAAQSLFWFNFILLCAYLFNGFVTPRLIRHGMSMLSYVLTGMAAAIVVQVLALALGAACPWWLWLVFAVASSTLILGQSLVGMSFPAQQVGRANTAYNLMIFIGAFTMQWGLGGLIDVFVAHGASRAEAFRWAFTVNVSLQAGALTWCWLLPRCLAQRATSSAQRPT